MRTEGHVSDPETWRREYMSEPVQLPPEIDTTVPSVARGYDYALGGKNNFEVDRVAVDTLFKTFPGVKELALDNRAFLRRGVHYLVAEAGIKQIIDVGSGLPSAGNVHEVAHAIDPSVRVVYVDIDPIVLAHARALLAENDTTTVIQADAAKPESILGATETVELIDMDRPYAVLLSGILHHLHDEQDPQGVARTFREALPSGGYLLNSNFLDDDDQRARDLDRDLAVSFGTGRFRTWDEHRAYFEGLEIVDPGLVYANDWRPDGHTKVNSPWHGFLSAGIGRKP
jgi:SAM-dependent methyltransferase